MNWMWYLYSKKMIKDDSKSFSLNNYLCLLKQEDYDEEQAGEDEFSFGPVNV